MRAAAGCYLSFSKEYLIGRKCFLCTKDSDSRSDKTKQKTFSAFFAKRTENLVFKKWRRKMENTVNSRQRFDKPAKASKCTTQFLAFAEIKSLLDIMDRSEKNP